jgi:hypothetical protein
MWSTWGPTLEDLKDLKETEWATLFSTPTFEVTCKCPKCSAGIKFTLGSGSFPFETFIRCTSCRAVSVYMVKVTAKVLPTEDTE